MEPDLLSRPKIRISGPPKIQNIFLHVEDARMHMPANFYPNSKVCSLGKNHRFQMNSDRVTI
jgi:hypothetical protein